jgi:hypothetical protein
MSAHFFKIYSVIVTEVVGKTVPKWKISREGASIALKLKCEI